LVFAFTTGTYRQSCRCCPSLAAGHGERAACLQSVVQVLAGLPGEGSADEHDERGPGMSRRALIATALTKPVELTNKKTPATSGCGRRDRPRSAIGWFHHTPQTVLRYDRGLQLLLSSDRSRTHIRPAGENISSAEVEADSTAPGIPGSRRGRGPSELGADESSRSRRPAAR